MIDTARSAATSNLAPSDGIYELNGLPHKVRKGDPLPPGAAFAPSKEVAAPTGPQALDARRASAALGEGYAAALRAAGYELVKAGDAKTQDGGGSDKGDTDAKAKAKSAGPNETTDAAGPAETAAKKS